MKGPDVMSGPSTATYFAAFRKYDADSSGYLDHAEARRPRRDTGNYSPKPKPQPRARARA